MQPTTEPSSPRHILFLHGIFNTGRVCVLLADDARRKGFITHTPSLHRADGRATLCELADEVRAIAEQEIPKGEPFHLVGFSMGGVIARYYAQVIGGRERLASLTTIGSPHYGSVWAYMLPLPGCRELRPQSALLQTLQETERVLDGLPLFAVSTPLDTMILPPSSAVWERASNMRFAIQFHPFMPYSRRVRGAVMDFILSVENENCSH